MVTLLSLFCLSLWDAYGLRVGVSLSQRFVLFACSSIIYIIITSTARDAFYLSSDLLTFIVIHLLSNVIACYDYAHCRHDNYLVQQRNNNII